jgi:hypothetical protein
LPALGVGLFDLKFEGTLSAERDAEDIDGGWLASRRADAGRPFKSPEIHRAECICTDPNRSADLRAWAHISNLDESIACPPEAEIIAARGLVRGGTQTVIEAYARQVRSFRDIEHAQSSWHVSKNEA